MRREGGSCDGRGVLAIVAVSLATIWLYLAALSGPLLLDDSAVIAPLLKAAQLGQDWRSFLFSSSGPLGRPVAMASFLLDAHFYGDHFDAWKANNLALHVLNGVLIWALSARLAHALGHGQSAARLLAVGTAGLWLLHPLHVSTVMYLTQRMTELATLFSLLAMLLYARGRLAGAATTRGRLAIAAALLCCTPLAALAKETGLLTPFYLAALEICVFAGERWPRPRWLSAVLLAVTVLPVLAALVYGLGHWRAVFVWSYAGREFGLLERVLTEARVVLDYLGWIIAPRRAALGFYHDDVEIAQWPPTLATLFACVALATLAIAAVRGRRRAPLVAFGVLLFFVGHALESTVFPLELVFEHRNYLPAIGICLAMAAVTTQFLGARRGTLLLATLGLLYGGVTASMTPLWGNAGALYTSFVTDHPRSLRARATQVEWLLERGALRAAERLLGEPSDSAGQLHRLRLACLRDGQAGEMVSVLGGVARVPRPDDMTVTILLWLAGQAQDGPCRVDTAAVVRTIEVVRDRPIDPNSRLHLYLVAAQLRLQRGELGQAAAATTQAAILAPQDPFPRYLGAEIALDAGDHKAARALLDSAHALVGGQYQDFSAIERGLEARLRAP